MTNLKKRVASQKVLRFLQNNKVIFFYQKKSVRSDHWRLLKKEIAKIEGVSSLNIKNKRFRFRFNIATCNREQYPEQVPQQSCDLAALQAVKRGWL